MKMNKLTSLLLAATLGLASGAALAADTGAQSNNGQANAAADAGQVAPMRVKTWRQTTSTTVKSTPVPPIPTAPCSTLTARP